MVQHRASLDLDTQWDERLSYLLAPALASYETERLTGRGVCYMVLCATPPTRCMMHGAVCHMVPLRRALHGARLPRRRLGEILLTTPH